MLKTWTGIQASHAVVVKKWLGSSLQFIHAFIKEARLLHDLNHGNIVQFKAVCHEPVSVMLEYVYFDLSVFGGEGKVSSSKDFISCLDTADCNGVDDLVVNKTFSSDK